MADEKIIQPYYQKMRRKKKEDEEDDRSEEDKVYPPVEIIGSAKIQEVLKKKSRTA